MDKVLVNSSSLIAIGDAIRQKNKDDVKYLPSEMAQAILDLPSADYPESMLNWTGDCSYRDQNGWVDDFISKHKITTTNINNLYRTFSLSGLKDIPFELNLSLTGASLAECFNHSSIVKLPKVETGVATSISGLCQYCEFLIDISNFNTYIIKALNGYYNMGSSLSNCYRLKRAEIWPQMDSESAQPNRGNYSFYRWLFNSDYSLVQVKNLPVFYSNAVDFDLFQDMTSNCYSLASFTFEPGKTIKWSNQTIDLSGVGWAPVGQYSWNQPISAIENLYPEEHKQFKIIDDVTYQTLKDNEEAYTNLVEYSRYNHDSAVETINSLPDTSAYVTSSGKANVIKFKKDAGSKTDGGAISTLTEAEIDVATQKGWTVILVD